MTPGDRCCAASIYWSATTSQEAAYLCVGPSTQAGSEVGICVRGER